MATQKRLVPDRRIDLRIKVHLGCQIAFDGNEYEASIKDISPIGAYLWSSCMPPRAADVSITIKMPPLSIPIILEGKVVRRYSNNADQDQMNKFAVEFIHNSPALMVLIDRLENPRMA